MIFCGRLEPDKTKPISASPNRAGPWLEASTIEDLLKSTEIPLACFEGTNTDLISVWLWFTI